MIIGLLVVAAAGSVAYAAYKHVTLAQVEAEVAKIEAEAVSLEATVKAKVLAIVAAIKAKL
ncbi:MAG: hypothetical protein WCA15_20575 [Candidatus Acidiferrales bacterium]